MENLYGWKEILYIVSSVAISCEHSNEIEIGTGRGRKKSEAIAHYARLLWFAARWEPSLRLNLPPSIPRFNAVRDTVSVFPRASIEEKKKLEFSNPHEWLWEFTRLFTQMTHLLRKRPITCGPSCVFKYVNSQHACIQSFQSWNNSYAIQCTVIVFVYFVVFWSKFLLFHYKCLRFYLV